MQITKCKCIKLCILIENSFYINYTKEEKMWFVWPISAISGHMTAHGVAGFHSLSRLSLTLWSYLCEFTCELIIIAAVGTLGKQKREFPPLWNSERSCSSAEVMRLWCVSGNAEEDCLHPEHPALSCGHLWWGEGKTRVCDVIQQHKVRRGCPGPDAMAYSVKGGKMAGCGPL